MTPLKIYTRKELVVMDTSIADFHTSLYIPEIKKLVFHLPQILILGDNRAKPYVVCRCDYAERVVASFAHQIQCEYYGRNLSVSIEGIVLDNFSAPTQAETAATPQEHTRHDMFH